MRVVVRHLIAAMMLSFAVGLFAVPTVQRVIVPQGTLVNLVFDQPVSSETARVGDIVYLHVRDNVGIGPTTVIRAGTPVTGVLTSVKHRQHFGVNAKIMMALNPVMSTFGRSISLDFVQAGHRIGGSKSTTAGAASVGGAILLGPVGLVGGFFVSGKRVEIRAGQPLTAQVAVTTRLRRRVG